MKKFLYFVVLVSVLGIIALLWRWLLMPDIPKVLGNGGIDGVATTLLAAQASQYALLQIHLVILTIFLAIASLWGYSGLKNHVEGEVRRRVDKIVPKLVDESLKLLSDEELNKRKVEQSRFESENSKTAFRSGFKEMRGENNE